MMKKIIHLFLLVVCSISAAQAEQTCPSQYDYVINNFPAKISTYEDSELGNIEFIAQQIVDNLDSVERIDVFGHAATWPNLDLQTLSEQRAELVLDSIVSEVEERIGREVEFYIYFWGLADTCPVASNDTQSGRETNRRVQVKLTLGESEEQASVDENCLIGEKLAKADMDVLATSPQHAKRLKFLQRFIKDDLCGKKQDDRFYLFKAKDGFGRSADKCGTSRQILSAKTRKKKGRVMRGYKLDLTTKTKKKKLAKRVLWTEENITCEINKVLGAVMSLASETPAVKKSDECKVLRKMRTASFRTAPDTKSVYRGWRRMLSKAASKHCG